MGCVPKKETIGNNSSSKPVTNDSNNLQETQIKPKKVLH